jgi:hypothetical protein
MGGLVAPAANAANHALLIGIGQYKIRILEGPPHDVAALMTVLASRYDFSTDNIRTLVNQEASKARILSEIKQLTRRTRPGDRIFIYFSGHGTSRRDDLMALPLPHASGALVPADFSPDPNQSIEAMMSQLIVGRRDLRPMLQQLDRDRHVLLVFDTCFSGNTVRAAGGKRTPNPDRYMKLASKSVFEEEHSIGSFEDNLIQDASYPYANIFYIAASSENEIAKDIQEDLLYLYPTIDGKPHGALTDALLRVLSGQVPVDANNDGRWSQMEMYTSIRSLVQERFQQTPQALPRQGENAADLHARTFFTHARGRLAKDGAAPANAKPRLRVQITNALPVLKGHVSRIDGVQVVNAEPDLTITKDGDAVILARPDKDPLCRFTSFDVHQVVDRIRRHLRIQSLVNLVYPRQRFRVELELSGGSYPKNTIREDETFGFEIRTDKPAYLLLIDVDPAGAVHVLYPSHISELKRVAPGEKRLLAEGFRTHWPYGTETVKLFAFVDRPKMMEMLVGKEDIQPESELFNHLERLVGVRGAKSSRASVRQDVAQAALQLTSYPHAPGKR